MKHLFFLFSLCLLNTGLEAQNDNLEYGLASYYSDDFEGRTTAYGDTYDKDQLTCAHKMHPYGTRLKVTRLDTKKSVTVKVIDKGPFIRGRVVDLSRRAASILGILDMDHAEVKVEVVGTSAGRPASTASRPPAPAVDDIPASYDEPVPTLAQRPAPEPIVEDEPEPVRSRPEPILEERSPEPTPARETTPEVQPSTNRFAPVGKDFSPYGLYKITLEKPVGDVKYGVQVGSFSNYENVLQRVAELQAKWFDSILVSIEPGTNGTNQYKVILGPFDSLKYAQRYQENLQSRYQVKGFVIDLSTLNQ